MNKRVVVKILKCKWGAGGKSEGACWDKSSG